MSYAITYSSPHVGVEAPLVSVETHLSSGLPALTIVGINNPHDFVKA
jgi:magnesium chelatase family protein